MSRARVDAFPRWPGRVLGMVAGLTIAVAGELLGHYLGTHVPQLLTALDDGHDVDLTLEEA